MKNLLQQILAKQAADALIPRSLYNNTQFPSKEVIFKAFNIDREKTKVIIVGQDPYPNEDIRNQRPVATGLAFGLHDNNSLIQPSLQMIIDELALSYYNDITFDAQNMDLTLQNWVDQGVMLLNASLTVDMFSPEGFEDLKKNGKHSNYWREVLMEEFFKELNKDDCHYIFAFLGQKAQYYAQFIDDTRHFVYKVIHPVADYRIGKNIFRGSKIFNNINESLAYLKKEKIEWKVN